MKLILSEKNRISEKGFTLAEALVTVLVVGISLIACMLATTGVQRMSRGAFERTVAIQDASRVIEDMRNAAVAGSFPSNIACSGCVYQSGNAIAGFANLTNEIVRVTYVSSTANPLDTTVTVTWTDNNNRPQTAYLRTFLTQRG